MKKLALLLALILAANPAFAALKGFSQSSTPTLTGPIFTGQASPTYAQGKLTYDTDNESLTFYNNDSNISLQIGQENWVRVINNSGSSIANGSAVKITGASGGLPTIGLIQANASDIALGLITETLADGATGYVTVGGLVRGLDTSGFSAGATLYVSSSVAGGLTATAPSAPNYRMRIGTVGVSNASTGTILVNSPTSGLGFGSANQVLGINSAATAQEYKTLAVGTSGTDFAVANAANSVTFNLPDASATARGAVTTGTQTIAGVKTFSSTITGSVSGNAATVTTNANLTGAVTSVGNAASLGSFSSANLLSAVTDETGSGVAVFGTSPTIGAPLLASGTFSLPQGRLTLTTATPVQTADATAQTTIYYTPYAGTHVPIYNGTNFVLTAFTELSVALDSNAGHTGYQQSGKNFDLFIYNDSGTNRLGTGPAWTSDAARANAISQVNGIWVNTSTITLRFGSASGNTTSVAASQGTYVGTMRGTADGQTGMNFNPAAASGGTNNILGIYNAYNKVFTCAKSQDSAAGYSYTSGTIRATNASNSNRISMVLGLLDTFVEASHTDVFNGGAGAAGIYVGLDSTSAANGSGALWGAAANASLTAEAVMVPGLGFHYVQALESGASAATFGTSGFQILKACMSM